MLQYYEIYLMCGDVLALFFLLLNVFPAGGRRTINNVTAGYAWLRLCVHQQKKHPIEGALWSGKRKLRMVIIVLIIIHLHFKF